MAEKQTQVTITGLAQGPNPFGNLSPGSLQVADNVVIRRKGVLSPLPGNDVISSTTSVNFPVKMFGGDRFDYAFTIRKEKTTNADTLDYFSSSGVLTTVQTLGRGSQPFDLRFNAGETHQTFARDRYFFSEHSSPVVYDISTTDQTLGALRPAGLSPPAYISIEFDLPSTEEIAVIDNNNYGAYKAVFRRQFESHTLVSAPTTTWAGQNTAGGAADVTLQVQFDPSIDTAKVGDFIDIYKTPQAASLAELGGDFRLCASYELVAADLVFGQVDIVDKCQDDNRGAPLYTNDTQEGAASLNLMPPSSRDLATHKDINWYVSKNTWPVAVINVPSMFGDLIGSTAAERQNGVGRRSIIGDVALGSHFITNVSAADRVGLAVGQILVDGPAYFEDDVIIIAINGSGPYSIGVSGAVSTGSGTGDEFRFADTMEIRASKDGNVTSSTFAIQGSMENLAFRLFQCSVDDVWGMRLLLNETYDSVQDNITGVSFAIWSPIAGLWDSFQVVVTNGQNYSPSTPISSFYSTINSVQDTQTNRVFYSKSGLPEAVAATNYLNVGAGKILKLWPTQSSIFALCTDGLWRIAGDGTNWQVEQLDPTVNLLHPDCVCSLNNQIFAWLTDGIAVIGDQGSQVISTDAIGPQLREYIETFREQNAVELTWGPAMTGDDYRKEVWLNLNLPPRVFDDENEDQLFFTSYIFNTDTGAFTTQSETEITCLAYNPYQLRVLSADFSGTAFRFLRPSTTTWCRPSIRFNPIVAGDIGYLKQWMDVNLFFQEMEIEDTFVQGLLLASFDGIDVPEARAVNAQNIQKTHYWIPRRCALKEQLILGFSTVVVADSLTGTFNFNLYGFSVRCRVASETLKKG